jgi:hypothetical protein
MVLAGCEGLVTSNVNTGDDKGSGHYYVDLVPGPGIPVVEDLNAGGPAAYTTSYVLAEAFNKYDAVYYVGDKSVTVPPGKTLYVAPGSAVPGFHVAAEVSSGNVARAGTGTGAGPAKLVVLDGATMPLTGASTLGGLLQVNVGGAVVPAASGASPGITGVGRVVVGGKVEVDSITVAGDVYIAQGNGRDSGLIKANIDTTYLAHPTTVPDGDGRIGSVRSDEDFYAFETVKPEASREVRVAGVALGNIRSGGNVYVAENSSVTGLNTHYGYVAGPGVPAESEITGYGDVEVLGNVAGRIIAKGAVTVGSALADPHRAQVSGTIYSRTGNVRIKTNANSGDIVAYRGSVTIEKGAAATGIDTCYNDSSYSGEKYDGSVDVVNRGDVIVFGRVENSIAVSKAGSSGSGNISAGGSVIVRPYGATRGVFSDDGYVEGSVTARRSATIDGVMLGSLDTSCYPFDGIETQNAIVNGLVGGHVSAGGSLVVADHHRVSANVNSGKSVAVSSGHVYANGYVGGGAAVHGHYGEGPSVINGFVEGGSFSVGSAANVVIASTGRVNTIGPGNTVTVSGKLAIAAGGELDANATGDIMIGYAQALTDIHLLAQADGLYAMGHLGPSTAESGIAIESGARIYTRIPVAIPVLAVLDYANGTATGAPATALQQDAWFSSLARSASIHTNVAPPVSGITGGASPLDLVVGRDNAVTLTRDTVLAGNVTVNGLIMLDGYALELNGSGVIVLGSDNSPLLDYNDTNYSNGSISFAPRDGAYASSVKFNTATAALNGLGAPAQYPGGNTAAPVVTGVQSSYSDNAILHTYTVARFTPPVATRAGGPGDGIFVPGAGAVLAGDTAYPYGEYAYISKTSNAVWQFSAP